MSDVAPRAQLLLANRSYADHDAPRSQGTKAEPGGGGLLAAVRPVIAPWDGTTGTTWIGAGMGLHDREWTDPKGYELLETPRGPLRHRRLFFDAATWRGHYADVANSFIWPLYHLVRADLPAATGYYPVPAAPSADARAGFEAVNAAFADAAAEEATATTCWVHDYQLSLVPAMLRERGFAGRIGFFLHIPFPDLEIAGRYLDGETRALLRSLVGGMLGADVVGLQTEADVRRFSAAAMVLCGATEEAGALRCGGRLVRPGAYPVGIDPEEVLEVARQIPPPERAVRDHASEIPLVVGLERGDFTKGIPERLRALTAAYQAGYRFDYIGIASPTRPGIESYEALEALVDEEALRAQEAAFEAGCPFTQVRANMRWDDVVALQREASVVFTSSLADGLNLVPLQAATAQSLRPPEERGVIICGADAGIAHAYAGFEKDGLVAVDPLDPDAMLHVFTEALARRPGTVSDRLVEAVRGHDSRAWATRFLTDLEAPC